MEIVRRTEPILQQISKIEEPEKRVQFLLEEVKPENHPVALIDHEKHPTVHTLVRTIGTGTVKMFLVHLIEQTIRMLNISNPPEKDQVLEIAGELIKDHPTLKLEDYRVFFLNYRKGRYGKDYSRFDISSVYRALEGDDTYPPVKGFLSERAELLEDAIGRQKQSQYDRTGIDVPDGETYNLEELMAKHIKPKERVLSGSELRDKWRRKAAETYARSYQQWLFDNNLEDCEQSVVEFATKKPFNSDYIDNWIKTYTDEGREDHSS